MISRTLLVLLGTISPLAAQTVLVAPYLQPGNGSKLEGRDTKVLAWVTDTTPGDFVVEYGVGAALDHTAKPRPAVRLDFDKYTPPPATPAPVKTEGSSSTAENAAAAAAPTDLDALKEKTVKESAVPVPEKEQHYLTYAATLDGLPFDSTVRYRVRLGAKTIREGSFKTRPSADKPVRFVAVGDMATGKPQQNAIAYQIAQQKPDFMVALGDIVYSQGRVSQYMHHFWTTYNDVAAPSPEKGAPLFGSLPLYPVLGNHDIEAAKLPTVPDAFGAYYFFHVPQNGPGLGAWNLPLGKDEKAAQLFRQRAGAAYPSLNFYSWDAGPVHIVAMDSSGFVPTNNAQLRAWLERDLRESKQPWKIVCFHAPAFHTSREHYTVQRMRLWEPLFEQCGVNLVLAGHVHNYQRSKPLRFAPTGPADKRGRIDGKLTLDETFDGVSDTTPEGIIHIVSGGGGAGLYSVDFQKTVDALKKEHGANYTPLTARYVADRHSFSLIDATPTSLTLRQIDLRGEEIDHLTLTRPAAPAH